MLNAATIEAILQRIPSLTIGVVGDLFLDRYLDIDGALTEPSIETGLDAYQVRRVRSYPGAAGTVINNLAALGVGRIPLCSVIGDDGEGYELRQALKTLKVVDDSRLFTSDERRTPTYTKPMYCEIGKMPRELNRLDIKNRSVLPMASERLVLQALSDMSSRVDALLVADQVSELDCGVITHNVREHLASIAAADKNKLILGDSRERIGLYRNMWLKPNESECARAFAGADSTSVGRLAKLTGKPVFCTCGASGIRVIDPRGQEVQTWHVPAYPVTGPIDIVGAGDSTSAAIACALAAGVSPPEAAAFGCLVASITIQQLGTTGTATPEQVRARWQQVAGMQA